MHPPSQNPYMYKKLEIACLFFFFFFVEMCLSGKIEFKRVVEEWRGGDIVRASFVIFFLFFIIILSMHECFGGALVILSPSS